MNDFNDDKLKTLLKSDNSMPKAPADEWGQIEKKIGCGQGSIWGIFKSLPALTGLAACLVAVFIYTNNMPQNKSAVYDEEIVEFIFNDEDSEELYAWID